MNGRRILVRALWGVALTAVFLAGFAQAQPSNRWRAQFSGGSQSSGVLTLRLSPVGGEPLVVEIQIPANFDLEIVSNTVEHVRINLDRE